MDIPDITITVPPIDGFSILFPGYINNLDNARALLPSEEQLAQGREAGNCNVTLRWRPNDPLSHPLVATEHTDKQLLVLKIEPHNTIQDDSTKSMDVDDVRQPTVVRAVDEQEVEVAVAVTTVACCGSVYTFDNMADFQYVGVDVRPEEDWITTKAPYNQGPVGDEDPPLLVVPPVFSPITKPFEYNYRQYVGRNNAVDGRSGKRAGNVEYSAPTVPDYPDLSTLGIDLKKEVNIDGVPRAIGMDVAATLDKRPIWSPHHFEEVLKPGWGERSMFQDAQRALTYKWKSGPWEGLLNRRGYDPRNDQQARAYQAFVYQVPPQWAEEVRKANTSFSIQTVESAVVTWPGLPPLGVLPGPVAEFQAVPLEGRIVLCMCDIRDRRVDAILSQPVAVTACSKTTGWLTQEQQQEVQHLLKERLDALFTTHIVKKRHASVGAGSAGEDGRKEGGRGGGGRGGGEEEEAMFISLADVGNDDGDGGG